jgi:predicted helicase
VNKDYSLKDEYEKGLSVAALFSLNGVGICSKRDAIAFQETRNDIVKIVNDFRDLPELEIKQKYAVKSESRDQKISLAKQNIIDFGIEKELFVRSLFRPFDVKWTYFTNRVRGFLAYPVYQIMKHFVIGDNIGLCLVKAGRNVNNQNYFVTNKIITKDAVSTLDSINVFPLYFYPDFKDQLTIGQTKERVPNLNSEIVRQLAEGLGLTFMPEKEKKEVTFAPIDILDYIYAVLHSPKYRETYKEFLKIDFPRVPYPTDQAKFWELVRLGGELRELHLLESEVVDNRITTYPEDGNNVVDKPRFELADGTTMGRVWINGEQYFDGVPSVAWEFYIGGYQPAQKWLKDRNCRLTISYTTRR